MIAETAALRNEKDPLRNAPNWTNEHAMAKPTRTAKMMKPMDALTV
jgi:hypothetical protein